MPKSVKDQITRLSVEWRDKLSRNEIIVAAQKSYITEQLRKTQQDCEPQPLASFDRTEKSPTFVRRQSDHLFNRKQMILDNRKAVKRTASTTNQRSNSIAI
jgi:hypothetical protein